MYVWIHESHQITLSLCKQFVSLSHTNSNPYKFCWWANQLHKHSWALATCSLPFLCTVPRWNAYRSLLGSSANTALPARPLPARLWAVINSARKYLRILQDSRNLLTFSFVNNSRYMVIDHIKVLQCGIAFEHLDNSGRIS